MTSPEIGACKPPTICARSTSRGGIAAWVAGKRHRVELTSIRYASLSLLSRAKGVGPRHLLLAAWEYYRDHPSQAERS